MQHDFVKPDTATLTLDNGSKLELLWGDRVTVLAQNGAHTRVRARGATGEVATADLGGQSLLELYFIDVGQGDGVLIRTPDDRHILIDGGWPRTRQPVGKNAADFVDWKFAKDYQAPRIELDAMIASHCDADHYGGLWDLLNADPAARAELDAPDVRVENFYHAGVGWWVKPPNGRYLGEVTPQAGENFLAQLMGSRNQVLQALKPNADPKLQGEWAKFMRAVTETKRRDGQPTPIQRLSHRDDYLPGFEPATGSVAIKVLAPVEYTISGQPALRQLGPQDSKNTNGHSLLLRLDYGRTRVLLTGDLNTLSQRVLLSEYQGEEGEFACDVAKACHHGSDDVSCLFLSALQAAVTVISSGDNEGHDHPRPSIVAASAVTGYRQFSPDQEKLISPLIYSTELARSLDLGRPQKLTLPSAEVLQGEALAATKLECAQVSAGALQPTKVEKNLNAQARLVTGLVYGLVNVRTDGDKILCATRNEGDHTWQVQRLRSRFV